MDRPNYWGYDPMAFFSPHRGYAHDRTPGAQVREFKEMVKALHAAGIEVILDVVFNHTCEGNEQGPTLSFKGLENQVYYILSEGKHYTNYSGCGNTHQRQSSGCSRDDFSLLASLGPQLPHRWFSIRFGQHPESRPEREFDSRIRRWSN